ncbi:hypothetical protein [Dyadobacter sp. CY347]|uniref:hypothetical protein n=1 Tax=Dyadobacter sp. CY347 TaxID=2909336 RepID=UPI001F45CD5F|nr:hypothetical protein [Dyadobacter sp. CY347]MCF2489720.1 hypothetical protein [Dyadobacter sp. CY347]
MFYLCKRRFSLTRSTGYPGIRLLAFAAILATTLLSSCFLKQDRTTTVYGTITDQNGVPVDSILVIISGLKFHYSTDLSKVYSDGNGNYNVLVDVPKNFTAVDVIIPSLSENAKFMKIFSGYRIKKDDNITNNCCTASIGRKTKYDFQLIPK